MPLCAQTLPGRQDSRCFVRSSKKRPGASCTASGDTGAVSFPAACGCLPCVVLRRPRWVSDDSDRACARRFTSHVPGTPLCTLDRWQPSCPLCCCPRLHGASRRGLRQKQQEEPAGTDPDLTARIRDGAGHAPRLLGLGAARRAADLTVNTQQIK